MNPLLQYGTDESLVVDSSCAVPYAWRTCSTDQVFTCLTNQIDLTANFSLAIRMYSKQERYIGPLLVVGVKRRGKRRTVE